MRRYLTLLITAFSLLQANCQGSRVEIFLNPALHFNQQNVDNDDRYPASLATRNTLSAFGGLTYVKTLRTRWQLAGELGIGRKHHDITMTLPTAMYGPGAQLAYGQELRFRSLTRIPYLQFSIWAGYQFPVTQRLSLESRAGISKQIYLGGRYDAKLVILETADSAGNQFIQTGMEWANSLAAAPSVSLINPGPQNGELYIGCRI